LIQHQIVRRHLDSPKYFSISRTDFQGLHQWTVLFCFWVSGALVKNWQLADFTFCLNDGRVRLLL